MTNDEFVNNFSKFYDKAKPLVDAGKLPHTVFIRMDAIGYPSTGSVFQEYRHYRCIKCEQDFKYHYTDDLPECCPNCKGKRDEDFWRIYSWQQRWQCTFCAHGWISEDGTICPSCGKHYKEKKK